MDSQDFNDSDFNDGNDNYLDDSPIEVAQLPRMLRTLLRPMKSKKGFDGLARAHPCLKIASIIIAEDVGVRMMKEYFEIKVSKTTPQYGFRKKTESIW